MNKVFFGDCRDSLKQIANDGIKAQMCVTSPPYYGLRDYGVEGQIGLENSPDEYVSAMVQVFRNVRDVLADDGTLWLNIGDTYGKGKQLLGIPWRVALALQDDGWVLRQDIIWHKTNAMPSSVKDRCTSSHEYLFLLAKSEKYFFDHQSIKEPLAAGSDVAYRNELRKNKQYNSKKDYRKNFPKSFDTTARNRRSVWSIATKPYIGAHCAPFPTALIEPCVLAGSKLGDIVLDPFFGSGTTGAVAIKHGRKYIGCELNEDYKLIQNERIEAAINELKKG